ELAHGQQWSSRGGQRRELLEGDGGPSAAQQRQYAHGAERAAPQRERQLRRQRLRRTPRVRRGGNTVTVVNTLCAPACTVLNGIPVALTGGATPANVSIGPNPL